MPPQPCIAIAAGGTGGHVFPALALGSELSRRGYAPVLLTDARGSRLLHGNLPPDWRPQQIVCLPAATPYGKRGITKHLRAAAAILAGTVASWRTLKRLRAQAAVGFGGYPSFAPLVAARLRNIPVCVHEQNAVLGRANRMLAPLSRAIAFALPPSGYMRWSHYVVTGTPVRAEALAAAATPYRASEPQEAFRLLVFGGSQGARVLSETLPQALALLPEPLLRRLRITQQCRQEDIAALDRRYADAGIAHETAAFFADLPRRMSAAHLVLARSGASTLAELAVIGRPSILLPLPHSLDSDQEKNAAALAQAGGAWMLQETANLPQELVQLLQTAMQQPQQLQQLAAAAKAFGRPDAVSRLADLVQSLLKQELHSERPRPADPPPAGTGTSTGNMRVALR